eukprot:1353233-Pleurochrysis_carterae.AAC.1
MQVHEHAPRSLEELRRGAAHGSAEQANSVGHVGSSLRRAVQQRADQRLVRAAKVVVDGAFTF